MRIQAVAPFLALAACGCAGDFRLVPRLPWVEHASIALEDEVLTLDVCEEEVAVEARFHFVVGASAKDLVMTFPIAPPRGGAIGFGAWLGREETPLEARRAAPGTLPVGRADESWDIPIDVGALAAKGGLLVVRYRQAGRGAFAYLWRTGAYWRGPVRRLDVIVRDRAGRLASLEIDGRPVDTTRRVSDDAVVTSLFDVEPESGIKLHVR